MSDSTRDLLVRGIAAAKTGDPKEALFYLEWALRLDPPLSQKIDAWYWLSEIHTDTKTQRDYLEKILISDPSDGRARRKLAILDGKLDPADIIDPDTLKLDDQTEARNTSIERFTCPQCGGRMTYTPSGQSLQCDYCELQKRLSVSSESPSPVHESDFNIALATRRGHLKPIWAHSVTCTGCGAELILETGQLSQNCPYCNTPYALEQIEDHEIIPPDGILPLEISSEQAHGLLTAWFQAELSEAPTSFEIQPVYLPVWTFDLGGQVFWNCQVKKDRQWLPVDGQEIVYHNDMPVFASQQLPPSLRETVSGYDYSKMVDFDRCYLAGIKAENYQISAGDASLQARKSALEAQELKILSLIAEQVKNLRIDSTKIIVEAFRLMFVPAYLIHYTFNGQNYPGLLNGQIGAIQALKPEPRKKSFFRSLFD
jgi:uncharacterized CHY-type Zn-finger protein